MTIQQTGAREYTVCGDGFTATITDQQVVNNPYRVKLDDKLLGFYPHLAAALEAIAELTAASPRAAWLRSKLLP